MEINVLPAPVADAGMPQILDCGATAVTLRGRRVAGLSSSTSRGSHRSCSERSGKRQSRSSGARRLCLTVINQQTGCQVRRYDGSRRAEITFPEPQLSIPAIVSFGKAVISVDSVSNGVRHFSVQPGWGELFASSQFFNLSEGAYTVYVIDGNQCDGSAAITIEGAVKLGVDLVARSTEEKRALLLETASCWKLL